MFHLRISTCISHALFLLSLLASGMLVHGHPNIIESDLLSHFAVGAHPIRAGRWEDITHQTVAQVKGDPQVVTHGPAEALRLDGRQAWIDVAGPNLGEIQHLLPRREISVTAWVAVHETQRWGGICGVVQDNGNAEQGWVLGFDQETFTFGLATRGADDGDGRMTYLAAKSPIDRDRWYHVAATYDGQKMKLYINGVLESESNQQSADILYPAEARFALGAFADNDELNLLDGWLFETKLYGRVLDATEIAAVAKKNANLIAFRPPPAESLEFLIKPYLQMATTSSITVLAETNEPAVMTVEYGTRPPLTQRASSETPTRIHAVTLAGLETQSAYFYRVVCHDADGRQLESDQYSFQTFPGPNMPWAFGIIGDTQRNPEVTRRCADLLYALRPNMVIHCGDVVDDGFAKNQWLFDLFEPCSRLLAHAPIFPVIGNHEQNSHFYYDYFALPAPEYHYTFVCGNAQFFMIDSNKPLQPGSEQYVWLEKELAASKATWKFTCHHHPCFSSDENDYGDHVRGSGTDRFTWGDPNAQQLVPLYERYGVDIAFNGHIHVYERTWPIYKMAIHPRHGVRYITSGGGGGSLEQAAPQRSWFNLHFKRAHHVCYASVFQDTIEFKAYDIDDRLFDTFVLTKENRSAAEQE